jgi:hypothetical protein
VPVIDHWEYNVQDPSGSPDCVCQVLEIQPACRKVQHLQVGILGSLGALVKAFVLVDYSYCNIRLAGLGLGGLVDREMLEGVV